MLGKKVKLKPVLQETMAQLYRYYHFLFKEEDPGELKTRSARKECENYDFGKQSQKLRELGIGIPHLCRLRVIWNPLNPTIIGWYGTDNGFEHNRKSFHDEFEISEPVAQIVLDQMKEQAFVLGKEILRLREEEEKRLRVLAIVDDELAKISIPIF